MTRQLILHIGTSKTGSTAIQTAFARNRDALRAHGVLYPQSPGPAHHNLLAFAAMADHAMRDSMDSLIWNGMEPAARLAQFRADFQEELADAKTCARTVISSEFLYMVLQSAAEIQDLRAMLTPWFDDIRVVLYLRRQDAHFASFYTQLLRAGDTRPPDGFAMRARPRHQLDYAALVDVWEGVFGDGAVMVRLYEPPAAGGRFDAVADFAGICGVALPVADPGTTRASNTSMNLAGQTLLMRLGEMLKQRDGLTDISGPGWYILADSVTTASPGRGWQPSQEKAREFYMQYAGSNERLRQKKFPERARLFSDAFGDLPEQPPAPTPEELHDAACKTILELVRRLNLREVRQAEDALRRARENGNTRLQRLALTRLLRMRPGDVELRAALAGLEVGERAAAAERVARRRAAARGASEI